MIQTENLTKVYKSFKQKFKAVDSINFRVEKGDIFGFLGPNGAGKTTTIRMLTTILTPTSGTANVCGYDIIKESMEVKKRIGFMPEKIGFYEEMSAIELLDFYGEFYKIEKRERRRIALKLLEELGLYDWRNKRVDTFSHGMKKKLALAQSLLNSPELLILDEPTNGLDPNGVHYFREKIKELNKRGITIFLSSHILSEVQQICNKVCILNRGRVVAVDSIENLSKKLVSKNNIQVFIDGNNIKDFIIEEVKKLEGVVFAQRTINGLYVVVKEQRINADINSLLVSSGAKITSIRTSEPSLEDIFLELTK